MITRREELKLENQTGLLTEKTRQKVIENVLERLEAWRLTRAKRSNWTKSSSLSPDTWHNAWKKTNTIGPLSDVIDERSAIEDNGVDTFGLFR